jgi:hypothetical protein
VESRWLRVLLLIVAIPVFLGITPKASSADEPDTIAEVRAYSTPGQASLIARERVNARIVNRARQLFKDVAPGTKANTMIDIETIVNKVAGRLVEIQRTDENGYLADPDGGNFNKGWPRDLSDSDNTTIGGAFDPNDLLPNNYGTVGMGLLMAYEMGFGVTLQGSGQDKTIVKLGSINNFLNAAKKAGDALVAIAAQDANNLVSTDIVFLYGLSHVVYGLPLVNEIPTDSYYTKGLKGLQAFIGQKSTADAVDAFYDSADNNLKQLKLWQMACWVEAAKLYASDMVVPGLQNPTMAWADSLMTKICAEHQDNSGGFYYYQANVGNYVRTAGQAKVVEVLKRFYDHDGDAYSAYRTSLKKGLTYLKGLQYNGQSGDSMNGAFYWGGNTSLSGVLTPWNKVTLEDQCYGIQAMAYNFQTTWKKRDNYKGTYRSANYLINSMMAIGPAEENDYEVFVDRVDFNPANPINSGTVAVPRTDRNSEAIQALYYSCKEGDVGRSGNIIAYNALKVIKARLNGLAAQPLNGPEIVAADRNNDDLITDADITTILGDSVTRHEKPICSFLGQ